MTAKLPETLGALLERRATDDEAAGNGASANSALRAPGDPERRYDAPRLLTDARKTGNFCRQLGVAPGRTVAIADVSVPESVLSLFGAALLGAPVRFVSTGDLETEVEEPARVLIGPVEGFEGTRVDSAGPKRIAYGGRPDDPEVSYFERDVWSENPTFPPSEVEADDPAIETDSREYTHRELLEATDRVVGEHGLTIDTEVAVRAPLSDPRTVVLGVLAPLACGGTVLFPDGETRGDVAVVGEEGLRVPEPSSIGVESVSFGSS